MRPRPPGETSRAIRALAAGLLLAAGAQLLAPLPGPPLYDGLVTVEPYRWLSPPPGEQGGAEGVTAVVPVTGSQSPLVTLSTTEVPPQASLFAEPGALTLPPGTTSLSVAIEPVPVDAGAAPPADGHVTGNVYRVTIATQTGTLVTAPAAAEVTVILRAPDDTATEGTVAELVSGTWAPIKTEAAGLGASFVAIVTTFGDFALLEPGTAPSTAATTPGAAPSTLTTAGPAASGAAVGSPTGGIPPITIVAGIATLVLLVALAALAIMPRAPRKRREPPGWRR